MPPKMTDAHENEHATLTNGQVPNVVRVDNTPCISNGSDSASDQTSHTPVPLAICGMAMRLPGNINTSDEFWDFLVKKRDARAPIPPDRRDTTFVSDQGEQNEDWTTHGYMLDSSAISTFDGSLFSMTRAELERTDPQQRLLLELTRECFENAGETNWRGKRIAVYIGSFGEDWNEMQSQDTQDVHLYTVLGSSDCFLSNRISYEYNLSGPSLTVRTACSASLYALHLACQAVQNGQASAALVGGASLNLSPSKTQSMYATGALSVDASSKSFDADANGYARAEAVNMVFVKRLDDALRDGNPVRAIIRGTAVNSDGKTPGMTRPSAAAHEDLIRSCYRDAGLDHEVGSTAFFECHATGTSTGDPTETSAVANIFGEHGGVLIGTVKPNVGHSEAASGLTSLIKCVLALERKAIPPNIKFNKPNPNIPFEEANLQVPTDVMPWPKDRRERVSINSFGVGGANAHAILDSAASFGLQDDRFHSTCPTPPVMDSETKLLVFTANHPNSLGQLIEDQREYIAEHPGRLRDVAYTLGMRREHLAHRAFAVASPSNLDNTVLSVSAPSKVSSKVPDVAFVFTGQGAQWATMGASIIRDYPSAMDDLAAMDDSLSSLGPELSPHWTLAEELVRPEETSRVHKAELSQPLCAAIQIVIINLLQRWGISPVAVIGHSSGEIAAAYACGAMTMHEAIICAYLRGKVTVLGTTTKVGGMAAIGLGQETIQPFLSAVGGATVACENSPSSNTISGDKDKVLEVVKMIQAEHPKILARILKVDMAYHSHHMEELGQQYEDLLHPHLSRYDEPFIPFFSTVTGTNIDKSTKLDARYWRTNLESPVRFNTGLKELIAHQRSNKTVLVEIGPHSALSGPIRQIIQDSGAADRVSYLPTLSRGNDDTKALLTTVGHLFCQGHQIRFDAINSRAGRVLTDLPTYPWNRDSKYWHETRLSYERRMPKFQHHELLGSRIVGPSGLEPSWRNLFRLDTVPWCRDHKVGKDIVFPAAGYLAMASEATRQLSGGTAEAISLRQVHLVSALILTSDATEIVLSMRPHQVTTALESEWYEFTVSSCAGQGEPGSPAWTKHCFGQVRVAESTTGKTTPEIKTHARKISSDKWYKAMSNVGLNYGPHFQGLEDITAHPVNNAAVAQLRSKPGLEQSSAKPSQKAPGYYVHPTDIDSCLQLFTVALAKGQPRKLQTKGVPTYIREAYLGRIRPEAHAAARATASATVRSNNNTSNVRDMEFVGNCVAVNTSTQEVVLRLDGVQVTPLDNALDEQSSSDLHGGSRLNWQRDIDLCSSTDVGSLLRYTETTSREAILAPLQKLLILCCLEAAQLLRDTPPQVTDLPEHLAKFRSWVLDHADRAISEGYYAHVSDEDFQHLISLSPSERRSAISELSRTLSSTSYRPVSELVHRIYTSTSQIFSGEIEALEVLRREDGLTKLYDWVNQWDYTPFLRLLAHRSPRLRVLEIGAGTGGTTDSILAGLTSYDSYTFSDISAAFFPAAKDRFKTVKCIEFKTLDISRDPLNQGLEAGSFDLVIAANVLHATPSLHDTLVNVRKLLRPDGRLLLQELCPTIKWSNFIMGGLPGWWLGDRDGRTEEPYISTERWAEELAAAGFSFSDVTAVHDHEMPSSRVTHTIIAQPGADVVKHNGNCIESVQILSRDHTGHVASDISAMLQQRGLAVDFIDLNTQYVPTKPILSMLDLEGPPVLENMTEGQYKQLQGFFSRLSGTTDEKGKPFLLWLTRPCQVQCESTPQYATILGLLRVLRSELGTALASLEMEEWTSSKSRDAIWHVYQKLGRTTSAEPDDRADPDYEFAYSKGSVYIPRVCAVSVAQELSVIHPTSDSPVTQQTRLRVEVGKKGILNSIQWVERPAVSREGLPPSSISIEVKAVGMNFKDSMIAMGIVKNHADGFGIDCAGVVTAVGTEVQASGEFKVGDRVMGITDDAYSTVTTTLSSHCVKIPGGMSFEEAASMPTVYGTVIYSLMDLARLEKGQTILIHSACGGVGIAALNICRAVGLQLDGDKAEVFVTVGNEEKVEFLVANYGFPRSRIFCSRDVGFLEGIMRETDNKGVDIVLNSLSGELLHVSWQCVAEFGCMVELGKRDFIDRGRLAMDQFEDNRSFFGVDVGALRDKRPCKVKDILTRLVRLYENGEVQPIRPIRLLDAADMPNAIRTMQKGQHIGKLVVTMPDDHSKLKATSVRGELALRPDASYLLAGGLGGLGRSIAVWMAEHGARDLVFITRGDGARPEDKTLTEELDHLGCSAQIVSGSVSNIHDVSRAVSKARFPIAGVHHLSMVLRDNLFAEMPFDDWEAAIGPKVQGAWNLHNALLDGVSRRLDFFILFSSSSGILGQQGQANYAAANTFLDAFVQFRQARGQPASVIDLGVVGDVGYVSERKDLLDRLKDRHTFTIYEQHVLDAVELSIKQSGKPLTDEITSTGENSTTERGFVSSQQLILGLRSQAPLSGQNNRMFWKRDARVASQGSRSNLASTVSNDDSTSPGEGNQLGAFLAEIEANPQVLTTKEGVTKLARHIGSALCGFVMKPEADLDLTMGFTSLGIDSLVAIEMRNWSRQRLGLDISVLEIMRAGNIMALAEEGAKRLMARYST